MTTPLSTLLGELDALVKRWERRSRNAASPGEDRALKDCAHELRTVTPTLKEGIERLERENAELENKLDFTNRKSTFNRLNEQRQEMIVRAHAAEAENERLRTLVAQQRECIQEAVHAMHEQVHPGRPARRGMVNLETFERWCAVLAQEVPS